jgi:hypothetical protein
MEKLLQTILELDQTVVFLTVMLIAFCPSSAVLLIKKASCWFKTITVLVFGELGAILLGVLSVAAKSANVGGLLPHCTIMAIILAVMILIYAAIGHARKWEFVDWRNWMKTAD